MPPTGQLPTDCLARGLQVAGTLICTTSAIAEAYAEQIRIAQYPSQTHWTTGQHANIGPMSPGDDTRYLVAYDLRTVVESVSGKHLAVHILYLDSH